jgi:hypothetical protein
MTDSPRFRRVNQILDAKPRLGPFPADLIFPWAGIALLIFVISNYLFKFDWLWTILLIAWGCGTWWILVGSKPYKFLAKFIGAPRWSRGYVRYLTIHQYRNSQKASHKRLPRRKRKQKSAQARSLKP